MFTSRETATVLAALRYWQETVENPAETMPLHFDEETPLDDDEIDKLCENINCDMTLSAPVEDDCDCDERSWAGDLHDSACPLAGKARLTDDATPSASGKDSPAS